MKKAILIFSVLIVTASISLAKTPPMISIDVIIGNRAPAAQELQLMSTEEARHPNITKAMHEMEEAMKRLHEAPDDFGGHKGQAEADLKQAWISLRKALYYRIYKDAR
jgi:hypothetical protein